MTDDELVDAVRRSIDQRDVPAPASRAQIAKIESVCGFRLPPLLVRLYVEVANGGFGPRGAISGVEGPRRYWDAIAAGITDKTQEIVNDPDQSGQRLTVPLIEWGCRRFLKTGSDPHLLIEVGHCCGSGGE